MYLDALLPDMALSFELLKTLNSAQVQGTQIAGNGGTDVRDVLQAGDVVPVDGRFPLRSVQLIRRKPRVVLKSLVEEIQRAIRQSGPGERRNAIDERAQFQGSRNLALTRTHRVNPASLERTTSDCAEL